MPFFKKMRKIYKGEEEEDRAQQREEEDEQRTVEGARVTHRVRGSTELEQEARDEGGSASAGKNAWWGEFKVVTVVVDWEGDRRCWWRGYERVMDVNAAVVEEMYGGEGRNGSKGTAKNGEEDDSDMSEEKLWYSLKYKREMLVTIEVDSDVEVIFKGND
ncbi:hypothetical protein Cgig2_033602 [Carnegiea gigantea]|uniref:Uncharacterized protein n=1 Tax=Carnegiea gigantea TaxID=171969 RepID=A0A9Q1KQH4_9CARY|nr:hypothetical protein Cgig2_033602 [Carnegiea gigantea]